MLDKEVEEEIDTVEYDFAIPPTGPVKNFDKRHDHIRSLLNVPLFDVLLRFIFDTVISLCDPFTQPEETEDYVLSVSCISDLLISLSYSFYREAKDAHDIEIDSIKFDISTKFFTLLRLIHDLLNASDELKLRFVDNSEGSWKTSLAEWTPKTTVSGDELNLKLLYSMACVLVMSIQKMFSPGAGTSNLAMNPYLHYLIKLWKCHTNIILLGLEIDRRIEFNNQENNEEEETPSIIIQVLKGSSSVRCVLAWIINQNPSSAIDYDLSQETIKSIADGAMDLENEPILNFIEPLARTTTNGGAISVDMRLVMIALLIVYSATSFTSEQHRPIEEPSVNEEQAVRKLNRSKGIAELGDVLIDLEYADRFDEDIKYMLEYEIDDADDVDENDQKSLVPDLNTIAKDELAEQEAIDIQFDDEGRDWRDIVRGENVRFNPMFLEKFAAFDGGQDKTESDDLFTTWDELYFTFEFLSGFSIEGSAEAEAKIGQSVINTISKAIKDEIEGRETSITPDLIHKYWSSPASENDIKKAQDNNKLLIPIFSITKFELMLQTNSKLARAAMDEMLMCNGHRRLLIWFITHDLNLSNLLIDYVFQLAVGLRGSPDTSSPYIFSRQGGKVILSEVEQSMLLHEFFTNSAFYLSANEGLEIDDGYEVVLAESIAKKLMILLCLMISQLMKLNIIKIGDKSSKDDIHNYNNELQVLLIGWIGKVPEARQLYFRIKSLQNEQRVETVKDESSIDPEQRKELLVKYKDMTASEIDDDIDANSLNSRIIDEFARKIEIGLLAILSKGKISKSSTFQKDFHTFMANFNTLCKIERFAEYLFEKFEAVITSGDVADSGKSLDSPEAEESEAESRNAVSNGDETKGRESRNENKKKSKSKSKKKAKSKKTR
ncbi:hypothetical protein CANMA_004261 [Candida margitis]|uniref:uncharacterized protein n=1 Tax=Candida margitis TaxID=1775924 RepID=UPI002225BE7A|nr:uncharacterized protein CANMA_004261 [Candida margitis]KAI5958417.1 hypothetical protein CANMA_004261 [Candida margitis]